MIHLGDQVFITRCYPVVQKGILFGQRPRLTSVVSVAVAGKAKRVSAVRHPKLVVPTLCSQGTFSAPDQLLTTASMASISP